jgi:hypothetical protein
VAVARRLLRIGYSVLKGLTCGGGLRRELQKVARQRSSSGGLKATASRTRDLAGPEASPHRSRARSTHGPKSRPVLGSRPASCTRAAVRSAQITVSHSTCSSAGTKQEIGGVDGTRARSPSPTDSAACLRTANPSTDRAKRGMLAGSTGLEPAASGVTGRRSNQLNYDPELNLRLWRAPGRVRPPPLVANQSKRATARPGWWAVQDSNL